MLRCRTIEPLGYRFASGWGGGKTDMKVSAPIFNAMSIFPKCCFKNGLGLAIPSPATFPYIELYEKIVHFPFSIDHQNTRNYDSQTC